MNKGSCDNDACTELLDDGRHDRFDGFERKFRQQDWGEDTDGTGDKNHEQCSNAQRHIVVSILDAA